MTPSQASDLAAGGFLMALGWQAFRVVAHFVEAVVGSIRARRDRRELAKAAVAQVLPLRPRLTTQEVLVRHTPDGGGAA
jgi:hypothetical protein